LKKGGGGGDGDVDKKVTLRGKRKKKYIYLSFVIISWWRRGLGRPRHTWVNNFNVDLRRKLVKI
jgi:hypothetical protein